MTAPCRLSPRSCAFVRLYFSVLFNSSSSRSELSAVVVFQRSEPVECSGTEKTNVERTASYVSPMYVLCTCRNWTSSTQGTAMVGHIDRKGLRDDAGSRT